jgi:hypothetical protein
MGEEEEEEEEEEEDEDEGGPRRLSAGIFGFCPDTPSIYRLMECHALLAKSMSSPSFLFFRPR